MQKNTDKSGEKVRIDPYSTRRRGAARSTQVT